MAGKSGDTSERRKNRGRRTAPVIEMTAVELPPEPAAAPAAETPPVELSAAAPAPEPAPPPQAEPTPALEPAAETLRTAEEPAKPDIIMPPPPPPPPQERRLALPLAAAGLVGAVFGAAAGVIVPSYFASPPAVDPARILRIEQGLADLARRPAPAPSSAAELQALGQRLGGLESELKTRLEAQDRRIAAVPAPAAPAAPPPAVDLKPLNDRIGALDRAMGALDQKAEAARTAAADGLKAVEPQLQQLAARLNQTAQRVETTAAAPLYTAAEALRQAMQRGGPFTAELSALEALGVRPEQIASLKALAAAGAPTAQQMAAAFQPLAMEVARAGQPAATGLQALLDGVVRTRAVGPGAADTPEGLVSTIEGALRRGDVAGALAAWEKLPGPSRKASEAWAATARQREAAWKAVTDVQATALAALRKAAP